MQTLYSRTSDNIRKKRNLSTKIVCSKKTKMRIIVPKIELMMQAFHLRTWHNTRKVEYVAENIIPESPKNNKTED